MSLNSKIKLFPELKGQLGESETEADTVLPGLEGLLNVNVDVKSLAGTVNVDVKAEPAGLVEFTRNLYVPAAKFAGRVPDKGEVSLGWIVIAGCENVAPPISLK